MQMHRIQNKHDDKLFIDNSMFNLRHNSLITVTRLIIVKIVNLVKFIFYFLLNFIKKGMCLLKRHRPLKVYKTKDKSRLRGGFLKHFKLLDVAIVVSLVAGILILKKALNRSVPDIQIQQKPFKKAFDPILPNKPFDCSIVRVLLPEFINKLTTENERNSKEGLKKILHKLHELEGNIRKDLKDKDLGYLWGIENDESQIDSDFLALFQDDIKYVKDKTSQLNIIDEIIAHILLLKDANLVEKDIEYLDICFKASFKKINSKKNQNYINFCIKHHLKSIRNNLFCVF
jgi:hypothetical protein